MIVRDIDVLVEAARRASVSVTFSIPTLDEDVWRKTEPSTAHPRQRLKAVSKLVDAGHQDGRRHGADPPGNLDRPEQLGEVVKEAREAGATGSGRTCSFSARARGSTSWTTWPRTGRS